MSEQYTVFLVDGTFVDACDPDVDCVQLNNLSRERMLTLLDASIENGLDVVVRGCYAPEGDEDGTE